MKNKTTGSELIIIYQNLVLVNKYMSEDLALFNYIIHCNFI